MDKVITTGAMKSTKWTDKMILSIHFSTALYAKDTENKKKYFQRQFDTIKPLFIVTDRQAMDKTVAGTNQTDSEVAVRQCPYK